VALAQLPAADRAVAEKQRTCVVLEGSRLGSMGVPVKLTLDSETVFVCCKSCVKEAQADPTKFRNRALELRRKSGSGIPLSAKEDKIQKSLALLAPEQRKQAEAQKWCPITEKPLGFMGKPDMVMVKGRVIFTCCDSCNEELTTKADEMTRKVEQYLKREGVLPKK
jgi:hypothetical protein